MNLIFSLRVLAAGKFRNLRDDGRCTVATIATIGSSRSMDWYRSLQHSPKIWFCAA
jgi:hypothetical protein